jgi:tetratricopeptide (TPR) repeat protein
MKFPSARLISFLFLLLALRPLPISLSASTAGEAPDTRQVMLAKSHYQKGMKLLSAGKEKEGEEEMLESLKIFPDFADAHIQLGNLAMGRKDFHRGLECYLEARTSLTHLQGFSQQREAERRKRLQESIDILRERLDQLRSSPRAGDAGKIEETVARLEKLQQEQTKPFPTDAPPIPAELFFLTGNARMSLEQFDQAIAEYNQALSLRPAFGEVHNNLAVIYFYRKDYARVWEHLHAAEKAGVRINPQFREDLTAVAPDPAPPQ